MTVTEGISIVQPIVLEIVAWFRARHAEAGTFPGDAEVVARAKARVVAIVDEAEQALREFPGREAANPLATVAPLKAAGPAPGTVVASTPAPAAADGLGGVPSSTFAPAPTPKPAPAPPKPTPTSTVRQPTSKPPKP